MFNGDPKITLGEDRGQENSRFTWRLATRVNEYQLLVYPKFEGFDWIRWRQCIVLAFVCLGR